MHSISLRVLLAVISVAGCSLQEVQPAGGVNEPSKMSKEFFGLRTARYTAADLGAAKKWYTDVFGSVPYFDEPSYVGFNVGGFELGIARDSVPHPDRRDAGIAYWGVADAAKTYSRLLAKGAREFAPLQDVGGGVRIGAVRDPFGNILGVVENPQFHYAPPHTEGPGR